MIPSATHRGDRAVYVNSGTWIDKNPTATMTFVAVAADGDKRHVGLFQYSREGAITELASETLDGFDAPGEGE